MAADSKVAAPAAPAPVAASPAAPPKPKNSDSTCVKKQLEAVLEYEKKYYETHKTYSGSLKEVGVPDSVIQDCPGWDDPDAKTSYGGAGFVVRSLNRESGEAWSINNDKIFIQESIGAGGGSKP